MAYREQTQRRDRLYLKAIRGGMPARAVAKRFNVGLRTVYDGLWRARLAERPAGPEPRQPRSEPLFPIGSFTPASSCPHYGSIRPGSLFCCMVCHQSGVDSHPAMRRHPSDPRPERRAEPKQPKPTRKQRRKTLTELYSPSAN